MLSTIPMADAESESDGRFETLVRDYRTRVYGLCYRYTGNHADAEDLSQEVFLRAHRGLDGFRGQSKISTWLYRIAVNACLNWLSGKRRESEELSDALADERPGPVEQLGQAQTSELVREAVRRLPDKQRMTLVLRVYEELSHREIAELMGCPVGTSKANYFFALKNLRKSLEGSDLLGSLTRK